MAMGADLAPGTLLAAYRTGIFPWPDTAGTLLWWSPDPRAILPLERFHESRSLRRTRRRGVFEVTRDRAFAEVIARCGNRPEGTWIHPSVQRAYLALHQLGWAHSVETWREGQLAGGIYGVAIDGLFAAESMFHAERDASKVALASLVDHLRNRGFALLDVQCRTEHLASLGVVEVSRDEYLERLDQALAVDAKFE